MKLLIIRHADPDYAKDSLTEKGFREAEFLAERLTKLNIKACYVSPYGRAKVTASYTMEPLGLVGKECKWLREFEPKIMRPDVTDRKMIPWDWLPADWTREEKYFDKASWTDTQIFRNSDVEKECKWVWENLDQLLESHGYKRNGYLYEVQAANDDIICFFCHFGIECVLLAHLLNVSPMVLWHGMCAAPSSVTTLTTEERREGVASFRMSSFGDISHLYAHGEEPSFQARFCECFASGERHD